MAIKIDHVAMGIKTLEPGTYRVTITRADKQQSKSGNPMVVFEYTDQEGGGKIPDFVPIIEEAAWRFNSIYKACTGEDIPEGDYSEEELQNMLIEACLNQELVILVEEDTDQNGQPTTRAVRFYPV
jgi:hypothetical protein